MVNTMNTSVWNVELKCWTREPVILVFWAVGEQEYGVENGDVKVGPARSPLRAFKVSEFQGDIYVAI